MNYSELQDPYSHFEFFSGGVPSGTVFQMYSNDIARISVEADLDNYYLTHNLCFIGLTSYFEAFIKDHLGSVLSIFPPLIDKLREKGYSIEIPASEALEHQDELRYKIGFLIAQRLDVGSAKKINAIFQAIHNVTLLGKNDVIYFENILRDRNLIVHHAGTYTTTYLRQAIEEVPPERRRAHVYSLLIEPARMVEAVTFLQKIALNLIQISASTLLKEIPESELSEELRSAIEIMLWWDSNDHTPSVNLQTSSSDNQDV